MAAGTAAGTTTASRPACPPAAASGARSGLTTSWSFPVWSRRSTNTSPPWSRRVAGPAARAPPGGQTRLRRGRSHDPWHRLRGSCHRSSVRRSRVHLLRSPRRGPCSAAAHPAARGDGLCRHGRTASRVTGGSSRQGLSLYLVVYRSPRDQIWVFDPHGVEAPGSGRTGPSSPTTSRPRPPSRSGEPADECSRSGDRPPRGRTGRSRGAEQDGPEAAASTLPVSVLPGQVARWPQALKAILDLSARHLGPPYNP